MANETSIINGSFKGIPIAIDSGSVAGGRKKAIKQFPSRDTQNIEDLGLTPRKYSLLIIISDKEDQDYFAYRNSLLAALESEGSGELIHPLYGRIDDVEAINFSLNENFNEFGDTTVTVNFEISNNTGIPQSLGNVVTEISSLNDIVQAAIKNDIIENFKVTSSLAGNFAAAVDKLNAIINKAKEATSFIGEAAQTINEFSALIGKLSANVNSLVSDPLALADAITGLFESVNGLFASAGATFDTFTGFFDFGEDDEVISQDTAGRIERLVNNKVLNGAVSAASLGYAFLAVTRIDFETTLQIDEITAELDTQYLLVQEGRSSQEAKEVSLQEIKTGSPEEVKGISIQEIKSGSSLQVKEALTEMRVKVLQALEEARVNTSQIVSVETNPTTTRLLAYNYYGDDTQGEIIAELNGFDDVSFIEGSVEVLTA